MKRSTVFGMLLLLVAFAVSGCASQSSGQWDVSWDKTGNSSPSNNINWRSGSEGGGGNGLF